MGDARFTRLTNGFSWKVENDAVVSSHCTHHNFANTMQISVKGATRMMAEEVG